MKYATILVAGPGRTGTSFVTEILFNDLNISMGRFFIRDGQTAHNQGCWEDLPWTDLSDRMLRGNLHYWACHGIMMRMIEAYNVRPVWGWKDPRLADTLMFYLPHLRNPLLIWCDRSMEVILKSKYWSLKKEPWQSELQEGEQLVWGIPDDPEYWMGDRQLRGKYYLDKLDIPSLSLDFTEQQSRESVRGKLQQFLRENGVEDQTKLPPVEAFKASKYSLNWATGEVMALGESILSTPKE